MQIPLFPLHTVLAPGIALPLHVFEERYRVMIRRCLDTSSPFGVVLIREGSEVGPADGGASELSIAAVGTLAEIREASRYADGRWDILCVGRSRFLIHEVLADAEPYLVAEAELLPDEPGDDETAEAMVGFVTRRFIDYLRLLQPREGESVEPIDVQMEVEVEDDDDEEGDVAQGDGSVADRARAGSADDGLEGPAFAPDPIPVPVDDPEATRAALRIPDDPSALSFLLTGIVQVDPDRRQSLLEAGSAEERLREIAGLLEREIDLLSRRLAPYAVDRSMLAGTSN